MPEKPGRVGQIRARPRQTGEGEWCPPASGEHEEKATKKMKAKKYVPSVSPHISVVLKLCTGEVDDLSESDTEPFMEYDEDLPVKPAGIVPCRRNPWRDPHLTFSRRCKGECIAARRNVYGTRGGRHELGGRRQFEGL